MAVEGVVVAGVAEVDRELDTSEIRVEINSSVSDFGHKSPDQSG